MKKQAVGVCLTRLCASTPQGAFPLEVGPMSLGEGVMPLFSTLPKGGAKLALSEVQKQQLNGFSSSC